ncbi:MAG: DUF4838 domain-containing protein [bacterium]|nr:DUF4838 domain-containing protein [bacterium]
MWRVRTAFLCVLVVAVAFGCAHEPPSAVGVGELTLAAGGRSEFVIVLADDASPSIKNGAEELQRFLREMTGVELPIRNDAQPMGPHEIILGDNAHLKKVETAIDFDELGDEGYVIRTVGPHLVIAGGALRGTMYGVYGLLEDHLGCRWFTPDVSRIPKRDRLVLPAIDDTQVPVLEYREPFTKDCFDGDWCARNRMNSSTGELEEKHGGKVRFGAGMFVHTFNRLIPPEKNFDEHPEYFALVNGERVKERTQLCCTNEDVVTICIDETRKAMRSDPEAFVYSVSQNDWDNHCECAKCQAMAEAEDSQMAPVLYLVNRVAEAVEEEFPGKAIETLAYQWTRKAPKTMRPRPNVIIRLCSIECCFMHPLATCPSESNQAFAEDARGWAKVADRLWVWDYVTSFRHYLVPFPNLRVRDDNIRFFIENNVRGIFEQDVYNTFDGELSPLSGYLNAKLLWDQNYDEDVAINEFLDGVYGDAAKPIRKYIDQLHDRAADLDSHVNIWVGPMEAPYLSDRFLAKADALWDKAEKAVEDDSDTLFRVRTARLSVDYAILQRGGGDQLSSCDVDHPNFTIAPRPGAGKRTRRFFETAERANVTLLDEHRVSMAQYKAQLENLALKEPRTLVPLEAVEAAVKAGIRREHYEGSWEALPDFDTLTPSRTDTVRSVGVNQNLIDLQFALRYTGYFRAPRDGIYCFYLMSNDGSRMTLGAGDEFVIDNDGLHGAERRTGMVALKKGLHPVTIEYFQAGGQQFLTLEYEGPDADRQPVGSGELFRAAE